MLDEIIAKAATEAEELVEKSVDYQCSIDLMARPQGIVVRGVLYCMHEHGQNYTGLQLVSWDDIGDAAVNALSEAVANVGTMLGLKAS